LCTGDETDKDVANAIRYAVDNGASIINMSFGKGLSPNKKWVDQAVKYAQKKDVLIVHAAGNENMKNTFDNHFPNDRYTKSSLFGPKYAENWLEVGAVDWQGGERLAADFSNYGNTTVDVFAPGVDIYSATPENNYTAHQGTSMAAPVVAGLAAVLRSYFPQLTAVQVKRIIMDSAIKQKTKVVKPGTEDKLIAFGQLSVTGAIANAYEAILLAEKTKGKKKVKIVPATPESNNKRESVSDNNVRS
jgi:subtilisin family serine protease